MLPIDYPAIPLSFVAGPAVLANVCAILQDRVNIRHAHSVDQWRSLQSLRAGQGGKAARLYSDTDVAVALSGRRVRLQLRATELLTLGTCSFGVTSLLSLGWSILANAEINRSAALFSVSTIFCASVGLLILMTVALTVIQESASARALMRVHFLSSPSQAEAAGDQP
ncbi:hypothetical protein JL39_23600 [Rhizobium sp. YS-1r]|nr:hypothetical protein JL39_23600 [Rhizobium sp. YS-1r]